MILGMDLTGGVAPHDVFAVTRRRTTLLPALQHCVWVFGLDPSGGFRRPGEHPTSKSFGGAANSSSALANRAFAISPVT